MSFGDFAFVAAFIVFPLVIVALSIWGLRTLNQREHQPLARFSSDTPAESTQELPVVQVGAERTWAARVKPQRRQVADNAPTCAHTKSFVMPNYRGRGRSVARHPNTHRPRRTARLEHED